MTQYDPKKLKSRISRRGFMRLAGLTSASAVMAACAQPTAEPQQPAAPAETESAEAAMPLKGTKIKVLLSDFNFSRFLDEKKGEFTALTGIEPEIEIVAFNVILDQSEIELSSGSANYDVMWQVFIKAQRWMRAGWSAPLDDFIAKTSFDMSDFIPSTVEAMTYEGATYGVPFLAESTQMVYRADKLEEAGLAVPKTFDELETVLAAIHNPPEFYSYVMRTEPNGVHFPYPIWLQGYGGNVFRDPPNDLTPTLNTDIALTATEDFTSKIMNYSIAGSQIYNTPDCQNAMATGQAGVWVDALGLFFIITEPDQSQVFDKVGVALPPGGPAGQVPQIATHGLQIPAGSQKQEAAWEFIRWACSEEVMKAAAFESGYAGVNRISILNSQEYADRFNTGTSEIGKLTIEALNLSKAAYRVVPEFPEIGRRIGQAIGEIISSQKSVKEAMDDAQRDAEQTMRDAGHEISS